MKTIKGFKLKERNFSTSDTLCDVTFNYINMLPPSVCVHRIGNASPNDDEEGAYNFNINAILNYEKMGKDSWFSGREYKIYFEKHTKEMPKYINNKSFELAIRLTDNTYIYRIEDYNNFNIEEYWKNRNNSTDTSKEDIKDVTGLFPQWEADGFEE